MQKKIFTTGLLRLVSAILLIQAVSVARAAEPLDIPGASSAKIGFYMADLATGEVIVDCNSDRAFIPASITKALTSASVLTLRQPDERLVTEVLLDGAIDDGVARGNLKIRCSGDPTIESSYFDSTRGFADSICAALTDMGIRRIEGTVVIDQSMVPDCGVPAGWVDEDIVWPYGASHFGANFRDNKFVLTVPGNKSVPYVPDLVVRHTPAKGSLKVDRVRGTEVILTKGVPRAKGESMTLSTPNPAKVMRHEIITKLRGRGIEIADEPKPERLDETLVYLYRSPEIVEILRSLMFRSDNMMAEGMLRTLSPGGSRDDAVRSEIDMWEMRDVNTDGIRLEDGSGLSRNDRLTPRFLAEVFVWMASHVKAPEYVSLFPKAGLEGTMKGFLRDTPLEGRVAMKTGSMKGVQSYAGFLIGDDGLPTHVIVVMVNGFTCSRARLKEEIENVLLRNFAPDYVRPVKKTAPVAKKKSTSAKKKATGAKKKTATAKKKKSTKSKK